MSLRREHQTKTNPYGWYRAVKKDAKKLRCRLKKECLKEANDG